jgi:hypothetical protein
MKTQDAIFLAGESIPFGRAISIPSVRALATRDTLGMRLAAAALMFGGLACLAWVALGYVAAL